jgi:hypothetical protein
LAEEQVVPVLPALAGLLPNGGLRRGTTVAVAPSAVAGCTSLLLALLAGPSAAGSWCAAVGLPDIGVAAAEELGVDLARLALVPRPGPQWATVTAALLDALDVVVVRPPERVRRSDARRLTARARERGAVLMVASTRGSALGESGWPEPATVRLSVRVTAWEGLGRGHGHLRARRAEVVCGGRGQASRPRRSWLWLPSPEGEVATAEEPGSALPSHFIAVTG